MFAKVAAAFLFLLSLGICSADLVDIRYNTNEDVFVGLRDHFNLEYETMYLYDNVSAVFGHPTVGKLGFSRFFRNMANEKLERARKVTDYITDRGESLVFKKRRMDWKPWMIRGKYKLKEATGNAGVTTSLKVEMDLNKQLVKLHKEADKKKDPHLQDFLEREFLDAQVKLIRDLRILLARLTNGDNPKDIEFLIDQEFMKTYEK